MKISEASRETGVSSRAIRYYEEKGLVRPARLKSGYRDYSRDDVESITMVKVLIDAGLSTETIARIRPCLSFDDDVVLARCPQAARVVTEEIRRIDVAIASLRRARETLSLSLGSKG